MCRELLSTRLLAEARVTLKCRTGLVRCTTLASGRTGATLTQRNGSARPQSRAMGTIHIARLFALSAALGVNRRQLLGHSGMD